MVAGQHVYLAKEEAESKKFANILQHEEERHEVFRVAR